MFKVLGMYKFALEALCFLGQLQAPENLYDATLYFGGNANRRSRAQHTTGTVRNSASARWRQSNRSRTQYCVRSRCPNEMLQEGHHLIDSHHKKNNMKVRLNSIFLLRYKNWQTSKNIFLYLSSTKTDKICMIKHNMMLFWNLTIHQTIGAMFCISYLYLTMICKIIS